MRAEFVWLRSAAFVMFVTVCLAAGGAIAADYNEAVNGDLSDNGLVPSTLILQAGTNRVSGNFGKSMVSNAQDLDYLSIVVPPGYALTRLTLLGLNQGGANSFLGVQTGPQLTMPPTSREPTPLLGYMHIYTTMQGVNLLGPFGLLGSAGGMLNAGSYTFWINETDTSTSNWSYAFEFEVTPAAANVPAMPEWGLSLLALLLLIPVLQRRKSRMRSDS